jgi:hypothetical protein
MGTNVSPWWEAVFPAAVGVAAAGKEAQAPKPIKGTLHIPEAGAYTLSLFSST